MTSWYGVGGHLGDRVSALLDGAMGPVEEERAWDHVHACYRCRDLVEREGWVKTRLAVLGQVPTDTPDLLKQSLLAPSSPPGLVPGEDRPRRARNRPMLVLGGSALGAGAVGAAVVGMLALSAGPANAPQGDRRAPVTSLVRPTSSSAPSPDRPVMVRRDHAWELAGR